MLQQERRQLLSIRALLLPSKPWLEYFEEPSQIGVLGAFSQQINCVDPGVSPIAYHPDAGRLREWKQAATSATN